MSLGPFLIGCLKAAAMSLAVALLTSVAAMPSQSPPAGVFNNCPAEGEASDGGAPRDAALDLLKNRSTMTPWAISRNVDQIVGELPELEDATRRQRADWSAKDTTDAAQFESTEAVVTGFLFDVKKEGPEQPNCGAQVGDGDFHMWLVSRTDDDRTKSAIVELTPRWRSVNASWSYKTLHDLATHKVPVRITGWMLFDQEHPEQLRKTRGTLWEIHPITNIEEFDGKGWVEI